MFLKWKKKDVLVLWFGLALFLLFPLASPLNDEGVRDSSPLCLGFGFPFLKVPTLFF